MMKDPTMWWLLQTGAGEPAWNMALDEALLEFAAQLERPILRFYSWNEPAATFGYFQHYSEIANATALRPLIRRPTGGGLVPHDRDWTYSLTFPPGHFWFELKAADSYRQVHEWLQQSFSGLGLSTEVASCCRKVLPGQCFQGWEQFDLLWSGRKIAGAAQRRNRSGLLIQGSVQPPPQSQARDQWETQMAMAATDQWQVTWQPLALQEHSAIARRAEELGLQKYLSETYNRRR